MMNHRTHFALCAASAALAFALLVAPAAAEAQSGTLYVNSTPFPTSATSIAAFHKIGRKHNKKKLALRGEEIRFHILLVFKGNPKKYKGQRIYFVLFQKGKKEYIDARDMTFPVNPLYVSPLDFKGSALKRGKTYELRAVRPYKRGKKTIKKIIARRTFKLK